MVEAQPRRTIVHVDMDAFFASIEQRDNPALAGKPVIVGSDPRKRGVVSTASYEARRYGVHSAMPIREAFSRCPHGVYLRPDITRYAAVSTQLREILYGFTPLVEPISLDEAFLDVTGCERLCGADPLHVGRSIKSRVREELRLVASVGIAHNKFLAKLASDASKPDGLLWVKPEEALGFLSALPVSRLWGVGEKTEALLRSIGVGTVAQLRQLSLDYLVTRLGVAGRALYMLARGEDARPVIPETRPKSLGREVTFEEDQSDLAVVRSTLVGLAESVARRARQEGVKGKTVVLKVRYGDFTTLTRSHSLPAYTNSDRDVVRVALDLLDRTCGPAAATGAGGHVSLNRAGRKLRLVGVSMSNLAGLGDAAGETGGFQLSLLELDAGQGEAAADGAGRQGRSEGGRAGHGGGGTERGDDGLDRAVDVIKDRFGEHAITRASALADGAKPGPRRGRM